LPSIFRFAFVGLAATVLTGVCFRINDMIYYFVNLQVTKDWEREAKISPSGLPKSTDTNDDSKSKN